MAFDFGSAESWETTTENFLGVGNHLVTIVEAQMGETKGTRSSVKPQLELKVENATGSRRDWIVITPNTVGKVVQVFDACGVQRPQEGEFDPNTGELTEECVARLRGRKVGAVIRLETSLKDATKEEPRIAGYVEPQRISDDMPADTRGLPDFSQAPSSSKKAGEPSIPF